MLKQHSSKDGIFLTLFSTCYALSGKAFLFKNSSAFVSEIEALSYQLAVCSVSLIKAWWIILLFCRHFDPQPCDVAL